MSLNEEGILNMDFKHFMYELTPEPSTASRDIQRNLQWWQNLKPKLCP